MLSATEKKIICYTALFIAVIFNAAKLMALRADAFISQYWHFNAFELFLQAALNFICCVAAGFINIRIASLRAQPLKAGVYMVAANLVLLLLSSFSGISLQTQLFYAGTPLHIFSGAYILRLLASQALMGILINILLLLRNSRAKEAENEQLRNAYLDAQLKLLKEELNPHFFFNTLSSLSAIVHEDPKKAQSYISHLSKIFRYTLSRKNKNLVTLKEELDIFDSYVALLKLRMEDAIQVDIQIATAYLTWELPYMSLQPLLENVTKHNSASAQAPLQVRLFTEDNMVIMQNNLQPILYGVETTGIGLANLNERFSILLHKHIEIEKTTAFTVKLPLEPA